MTTKNRTIALLLTGSNQDVYTAPANYEVEVGSLLVNNATSSTVTFSLDWYESSETTYHTIAETVELPANSLMQITEGFWLGKNDKIRGLASTTDAVTVFLSLKENFVPQGL